MSKEAMKLARLAINNLIASSHATDPQHWRDARQDAVTALDAIDKALAEQPAPVQQEPVVIDRSDAVNLARTMLEVHNCKGITSYGVQVLCEAVMKMDTALTSQPASKPQLEQGCCRSHPHDNMDAMCELRTEIARLTNENARLKSQCKPLTDEELVDVASNCGMNGLNIHGYTFARAIEAARGIKWDA